MFLSQVGTLHNGQSLDILRFNGELYLDMLNYYQDKQTNSCYAYHASVTGVDQEEYFAVIAPCFNLALSMLLRPMHHSDGISNFYMRSVLK